MPGAWGHLAGRFFWSLRARPLTPPERQEVGDWIDGPLLVAFFEQGSADQRHGLDAARMVERAGGRHDVVVTALCHDIGKRHARLGVVGRSAASVCARLRIPTRGRFAVYLDHGRIGAEELERLGAPPLCVDFARTHHGRRPPSISEEDWVLLVEADATVVGPDAPAG